MADKNMERLLKGAKDKVVTEWGRPAYEKLGARIQRALLAEAVLTLAALQDDSVDDAILRRIVNEGWSWVVNEAGY